MKKIFSLISALAIMATMAVSVNAAATEPTVSLEVSSTGNKAGDVVTVVCKYDGFDVTPYNDDEGAGQKITGAQIRIDIPGGIGTAAEGEQFLRPGVTNVSGFATGAPQWNWDKNNNQFTAVIGNIDDPMQTSGTVFTISMKLNKDVESDLVFNFVADFEQTIVYDNYADWEMGDTVQIKTPKQDITAATLKGATVELPADRAAAVSFSADENTYVEITKGAEVKNYFLPSNVKADATVYGLLKYTVDGTDVKSGDIFTIKAVDFTTKTATWSTNITVE